MSKPMPDAPEANKLGCRCLVGPNGKGEGRIVDGVREFVVSPQCPVHANPKWWFSRSTPPRTP